MTGMMNTAVIVSLIPQVRKPVLSVSGEAVVGAVAPEVAGQHTVESQPTVGCSNYKHVASVLGGERSVVKADHVT